MRQTMRTMGRVSTALLVVGLLAVALPETTYAGPKGGVKADLLRVKRKLALLERRLDRQSQLVSGLVPVNGVCVDVCAFDSDADGQNDCADPCPCDALNVDTDADATPDCIDPCPNDPTDACVVELCDDLFIPPGHLPPPGECRVWFPDRPPGHQPPPGSCDELRVPPGSCLIFG